MPKIEIDGQTIEVEAGSMIIEAADRLNISIPRFCYHDKLSIAANCRMCLVEVEKSPKTVPACATPVAEGMVVKTRSQATQTSQKAVMSLLLINHPLDCPICDQGGECELQDVAMGYGTCHSQYTETKRVVADQDIGPLIATEMTRCIHCTRCVRFGTEIGGVRELGVTGRGERARIMTFLNNQMDSELSGNVIDLCPVGALTSKPFRYQARAWELTQHRGIAPHDSLGSHVFWHTVNQQCVRVVPRREEQINECWLSDRDRFSYEALKSPDRLTEPAIKVRGVWQSVSYPELFEYLANTTQDILREQGAHQIGVLASPSLSNEEYWMIQACMRDLGIKNLDYRLKQAHQVSSTFDREAVEAALPGGLTALQEADVIVVIESRLQEENPIVAHRLRQATLNGTKVFILNSAHISPRFEAADQGVYGPDLSKQVMNLVAGKDQDATIAACLRAWSQSRKPYVLLGLHATLHPEYPCWLEALKIWTDAKGATLGFLTEGANAAGAARMGLLPDRAPSGMTLDAIGQSAGAMMQRALAMYWWIGVDPLVDTWSAQQAEICLAGAQKNIFCTAFVTEAMKHYADVLIPMAIYAERPGSMINAAGQYVAWEAACLPPSEVRPLWKIMRALAGVCESAHAQLETWEAVQEQVRHHLAVKNTALQSHPPSSVQAMEPNQKTGLYAIPNWGLYQIDMVVRHAPALQKTALAKQALVIRIHPQDAERLQLQSGQCAIKLKESLEVRTYEVSEAVPAGCLIVPAHDPKGVTPHTWVEVLAV